MVSQTRSVDNYLGTGANPWTNPTNAYTNNNTCITVTVANSEARYGITGTPFTIPVGAIIGGIQVRTKRGFASSTADTYRIRIKDSLAAFKQKDGTGFIAICADGVYETLGGVGDLWGGTWTPAHINSANFEVHITKLGGNWEARVDHIEVIVTYTEGWSGKVNGVTNPAKIMGVAKADIAKVSGVA